MGQESRFYNRVIREIFCIGVNRSRLEIIVIDLNFFNLSDAADVSTIKFGKSGTSVVFCCLYSVLFDTRSFTSFVAKYISV